MVAPLPSTVQNRCIRCRHFVLVTDAPLFDASRKFIIGRRTLWTCDPCPAIAARPSLRPYRGFEPCSSQGCLIGIGSMSAKPTLYHRAPTANQLLFLESVRDGTVEGFPTVRGLFRIESLGHVITADIVRLVRRGWVMWTEDVARENVRNAVLTELGQKVLAEYGRS